MAEGRHGSTRQKRRGFERIAWRDRVSHQIHTAVDLAEAPVGEASSDHRPGDPGGKKLVPRDRPVLSGGEVGDQAVR